MDLSIVILHHGSPKSVEANLKALMKAWLPEKTEVFVVNNGRQGANGEIRVGENMHFDLKFFEIPNKGYPNGNNFGFSMAEGEYFCILNPDVKVEEETFKVLLNYLKKHKKVGIVGPRLQYPSGRYQDSYRRFPRLLDHVIKRTSWLRAVFKKRMRSYLMWDKDVMKTEPVDWLTGAFQIFPRKVWKKIGPKNELYFLFMSDVEICRKAWEAGYEVHFCAETQAGHDEGRLSAGGIRQFFKSKVMRIHAMDAFKYYLKWRFKGAPKGSPSAKGN